MHTSAFPTEKKYSCEIESELWTQKKPSSRNQIPEKMPTFCRSHSSGMRTVTIANTTNVLLHLHKQIMVFLVLKSIVRVFNLLIIISKEYMRFFGRWLNPLMWLGYKKNLEIQDLYRALKIDQSADLNSRIEK